MNEFIISTDSTADLPESYINERGILIQQLSYRFGDEVYGKDRQLDASVFYERMSAGEMPETNATIPADVKESFENVLKQGKDILHIAFSSGLSASYNSAVLAANELKEEYPDRKICVVDTLAASLGQGLLVHYALNMKDAGKNIDEICKWLEENKLHMCHQFTVNDLFHLHRGGRVSKTVAVLGTMINVKPVLHVDDEGHLTPVCNVRGRKKSLVALVDNMEKAAKGYENKTVFISHGNCLEDAEFVAGLVKERFGINDIMINMIGPTIGAHAGVGTVALFFMGSAR